MAKEKQDIVQWLKTTTWFTSEKATIPLPPDVLRDLMSEIEALRLAVKCMQAAHGGPDGDDPP